MAGQTVRDIPMRPLLGGATLAVLAVALIHGSLEHERTTLVLALFLSATAVVYLGALLAQEGSPRLVLAEVVVSTGLLGAALAGVVIDPAWLALGYLVHGAWDWLHHTERVGTRVAGWFPPGCAAFDLVAGVAVLTLIA